jgi:hypothetical protein
MQIILQAFSKEGCFSSSKHDVRVIDEPVVKLYKGCFFVMGVTIQFFQLFTNATKLLFGQLV